MNMVSFDERQHLDLRRDVGRLSCKFGCSVLKEENLRLEFDKLEGNVRTGTFVLVTDFGYSSVNAKKVSEGSEVGLALLLQGIKAFMVSAGSGPLGIFEALVQARKFLYEQNDQNATVHIWISFCTWPIRRATSFRTNMSSSTTHTARD